jgi:LuxR family transcriptional regulator, maltose regulon positive regulatory protein
MDDGGDSPEWLLRFKLDPPVQGTSIIARPRLLHSLALERRWGIALVRGPAGAGKTTALQQLWDSVAPARRAWLTLDDEDTDPRRLMVYLLASLETCGISNARLSAAWRSGMQATDPQASATTLLNLLHHQREPTFLFLDDGHKLGSSEQAASVLDFIFARLPASLRVAIAARGVLPVAFGALRARGRVVEVDADQLRFTREESSELLGGYAPPPLVGTILDRTEGWPVGMRLARTLLDNNNRIDATELMAVTSHHLTDYFVENVLESLPEQDQNFLLCTSVAERLTDGLARSLIDAPQGALSIERLMRLGLPVTILDPVRRWYKYHGLFRESLRSRAVEVLGYERTAQLHERAGDWFASEGQLLDAAKHYIQCGQWAKAVQLVESRSGISVAVGPHRGLYGLLSAAPPTVIDGSPRFRAGQICVAVRSGRLAEARAALAAFRSRFEESTLDRQTRSDASLSAAVLALYDGLPLSPSLSRELYDLLESDLSSSRAFAASALCWAAYEAQNYGESRRIALLGVAEDHDDETAYAALYCMAFVGLCAFAELDYAIASSTFGELLRIARARFGDDSDLVAAAQVMSGVLSMDRGEVSKGILQMNESIWTILEHPGWYDVAEIALPYLLLTTAASGEAAQAEELSTRAIELARRKGQSRWLAMTRISAAKLMAFLGRWPDVATSLASAGLPTRTSPAQEIRLVHEASLVQAQLMLESTHFDKTQIQLRETAERLHQVGDLRLSVDALLILARCERSMGDTPSALNRMASVMRLSRPAGLTQPLRDYVDLVRLMIDDTSRLPGAAERQFASQICQDSAPAAAECLNSPLTPREVDVLRLLAAGLTSKEVAARLNISVNTASVHRKAIYRRLGVNSRSRVISKAMELHLL